MVVVGMSYDDISAQELRQACAFFFCQTDFAWYGMVGTTVGKVPSWALHAHTLGPSVTSMGAARRRSAFKVLCPPHVAA
jgi:hypothetical protein